MLPFTGIIGETKTPGNRKRCWIAQPYACSVCLTWKTQRGTAPYRTYPMPGVSMATKRSIREDTQASRSCEPSVGERSMDDDGSGARDIAATATVRDGGEHRS